MSVSPASPRRFWEPGGGEPDVGWIVLGEIEAPPVTILPAGLRMRAVDRGDPAFPAFVGQGLLGELLDAEQPDLADAVREAPHARLITGSPARSETFAWLGDLAAAVAALFDAGAVALVDPLAFLWWSEADLRANLVDRFDPLQLVRLLQSPEANGTTWLHTRGSRILGRPDVSILGVEDDDREVALEVVRRMVIAHEQGAVVPEGQLVTWEGRTWVCRHAGAMDDPNFNNRHLALERVHA